MVVKTQTLSYKSPKGEPETRLSKAFSGLDSVVLAEYEVVLAKVTTTRKLWIAKGAILSVIEISNRD